MTLFWFVLDVVLLLRLALHRRDGRIGGMEAILACAGLTIILVAVLTPISVCAILVLGLSALTWLAWHRDGRDHKIAARLGVLLLQVTLIGALTSDAFGLAFRPGLRTALGHAAKYFLPLEVLGTLVSGSALVYCAGLLLCAQETNLVVRWFVESLSLKPVDKASAKDHVDALVTPGEAQYNRGRVIGILERIAVYTLVIQGQYEALGLVLAAKGLARFQNLDNRDFAEYFLIGTFLSVTLAGATALAVAQLAAP